MMQPHAAIPAPTSRSCDAQAPALSEAQRAWFREVDVALTLA